MNKADRWVAASIISSVAAFAAFTLYTSHAVVKQAITVGTCLTMNNDPEPWEPMTIWKVETVGKRSYLVRKTPASLYRDQEGTTISFEMAYYYRALPCPPKT